MNTIMIPGMPDLIDLVCETYNVTIEELSAYDQSQTISDIRHIVMTIAFEWYGMSNAEAAALVKRNHSATNHARKKVFALTKTDKAFAAMVDQLTDNLTSKLTGRCSTN